MSKVYVELLIVEETHFANPDSIKIYQQEVFSKYNINRQDYEYTLQNYSYNRKEWEEFFDKAQSYIEKLRKETQTTKPDTSS